MKQPLSFQNGMKDGLPIALGYFPVAMTFGMLGAKYGFSAWCPIFISMLSFTGTGQFMGIDLIAQGATIVEITVTIFLINIRYFLMSLSLLQKLPLKFSMKKKLLIAFGITDENYAVAMQQPDPLTFPYMIGIIFISYFGWTSGTAFGTIVTDFLPDSLIAAFGIAIYGMFLAIIIPSAMDNRAILFIVLGATAISCFAKVIPVIKDLGNGWILIICGVVTSALGAYFAPIKDSDANEEILDEQKDEPFHKEVL